MNENIEKRVAYIHKQYSIDYSYIDIVKLANQIGFVVLNTELPDSELGFLVINKSSDTDTIKIIGVNSRLDLKKKRFILAKELAYWFLNISELNVIIHRHLCEDMKDKETKLDYFAEALLMPMNKFNEIYSEMKELGFSESVIKAQLASTFNVDENIVERRIKHIEVK